MREIVERFVGRYQIWRDGLRVERGGPKANPLLPFAFIAVAFLLFNVYKAFTSHSIEWRVLETSTIFIAFLVLFLWKPHWAWVMFPIWGGMLIVESPVYTLDALRYPLRVRVISACVFAVMGGAIFAYGFLIRKRYEFYRAHHEEKRNY